MPAIADAQATPHTFSLNWVRAPGAEACIASRALAHGVEQLVGPVFRPPGETDRSIEGIVKQKLKEEGFVVTIRVVDARGQFIGERTLEGRGTECTALNGQIILVIALAIDPESGGRMLPPELLAQLSEEANPAAVLLAQLDQPAEHKSDVHTNTATSSSPAAVSTPGATPEPVKPSISAGAESTAVTVTPPPARDRDSFAVEPSLLLVVGYGIQPAISPGATLASRVTTPWRFALTLAGTFWLPSSAALDSPGSEVSLGAAHAAFFISLNLVRWARFGIDASAGGAVGVRWVSTDTLDKSSDPVRPYLAPTLGLEARYQLGANWFTCGALTVAKLFPGDRFVYTDSAGNDHRLFTPAPAAGWVSLGVGYRV